MTVLSRKQALQLGTHNVRIHRATAPTDASPLIALANPVPLNSGHNKPVFGAQAITEHRLAWVGGPSARHEKLNLTKTSLSFGQSFFYLQRGGRIFSELPASKLPQASQTALQQLIQCQPVLAGTGCCKRRASAVGILESSPCLLVARYIHSEGLNPGSRS